MKLLEIIAITALLIVSLTARPNPVGMSVVRLVKVEGHMLHIENVDIVDGTPQLDIKPYIPIFDVYKIDRIGWFTKVANKAGKTKEDGRFS